jgi:hypothetical protein
MEFSELQLGVCGIQLFEVKVRHCKNAMCMVLNSLKFLEYKYSFLFHYSVHHSTNPPSPESRQLLFFFKSQTM